jgi:hypothetical protein
MSGITYALHYDTITLEQYREHRQVPRRLSLNDGGVRLDGRSLDERREARWLNTDWSGVVSDL